MISGSITALVTPMQPGIKTETGLDIPALEKFIEFQIANGTDAVVAVGTTGESPTVSMQENCDLIRKTVDIVNKRIPVIGGTGANSTREAIELTQSALEAGADACLLVTPYYNKPTQEGLYLHHSTIASEVDIPQILYNVPGRTACDMQPATVARLSEISNIIGIKEATGELDRLDQIKKLCPEDFILLTGDDETACEFMIRGGDGVISVTSNVAPALMHEMCALIKKGEHEKARAINQQLAKLHSNLFVEANPIPVKWAVNRLGMIEAGIRLPLTWMSEQYNSELEDAMHQAGIIQS